MTQYKLKDLKKGMKDVDVEVTVDFLGEKRKTGGFNNDAFIAGFVKDTDGGEIKMTFWNEDVKKAKPGKNLKITGGYVTEFKGSLQLHADKKKGIEWM
jgi:ssDNA-binding replication factor A large subunit